MKYVTNSILGVLLLACGAESTEYKRKIPSVITNNGSTKVIKNKKVIIIKEGDQEEELPEVDQAEVEDSPEPIDPTWGVNFMGFIFKVKFLEDKLVVVFEKPKEES